MSDVTPIGRCPVHGLVYGDDMDYNFPVGAECQCGRELEEATCAPTEEVQDLMN